MIHYKLTCIKDMPECNKDFSYSFSENDLDLSRPILFSSDIEENTNFNTLLADEYEIACKLWKPFDNNLFIICETDDNMNPYDSPSKN